MTKKYLWQVFVFFLFVVASGGYAQDFKQRKVQSLYSDWKAAQIGDVITILIVESTSGAQQSNVNSNSQSSVNASGSITGNLTSVLPLLGASSDFENAHTGNAATAQKDVLTGKMTAVVKEVSPNGNLELEGKRHLEVNGETHVLSVTGTVRPKDINSGNMVYSYNLANVRISYKKDGLMNKLGKPGWMSRWASWLMIAGVGAAAYLGVSAAN